MLYWFPVGEPTCRPSSIGGRQAISPTGIWPWWYLTAAKPVDCSGRRRPEFETCSCQRKDFEARLIQLLEEERIDIIVLAGFLKILSRDFVRRYPDRILNVHPSLIPSFCGDGFYGLKVHEAALEYGVKVSGATVHFVNEVTDGGRIIAQKAVEVKPDDTPETLQRRIMEQAEWILLPEAVETVAREIVEHESEGE